MDKVLLAHVVTSSRASACDYTCQYSYFTASGLCDLTRLCMPTLQSSLLGRQWVMSHATQQGMQLSQQSTSPSGNAGACLAVGAGVIPHGCTSNGCVFIQPLLAVDSKESLSITAAQALHHEQEGLSLQHKAQNMLQNTILANLFYIDCTSQSWMEETSNKLQGHHIQCKGAGVQACHPLI